MSGTAAIPVYTNAITWGTVAKGAYQVLDANLPVNIRRISVFDNSGATVAIALGIATGTAQAIIAYVAPGGGEQPLVLNKGMQLVISPVDGAAAAGNEFTITGYY